MTISDDLKEQEASRWRSAAAAWARWWKIWERAAQPVSDRLVELAGVRPGHVVLDLATGLGEPAITAARRVGPHGRVIATDRTPAMLDEARVRAKAAGLSNIEFREMDAETPNPDKIIFDAILCRWGFMFVPDLEGSLRRLLQILRPGGRLATAVWGKPDDVPLIQTSALAIAGVAPLPDAPANPLHPFRLSDPAILTNAMQQAGFAGLAREEMRVCFEFASAEEYSQFRRDLTILDTLLAEHYPPDLVEAAWREVTESARAYADKTGRVRFINSVIAYSGSRQGRNQERNL